MADIPDNVKKGLEIVPVTTVDEVLDHALASPLRPIEWNEEQSLPPASSAPPGDVSGVVTH